VNLEYYINKFIIAFYGSHTQRIISECLDFILLLSPYLVVGIIITSLIRVYISKEKIFRLFFNNQKMALFLATLLGVVSPLGTYIVIPLAGALLLTGFPVPALMAFIVTSPLINPNLFILTAGAFGYEMAIARTVSAVLLGILAGMFTHLLLKNGWLQTEILLNKSYINEINKIIPVQSFDSKNIKSKNLYILFYTELWKMTKYISKYFFLAIFIAALIKIFLPVVWIESFLGGDSFFSVLIATGAGIPFYSCGGAAIPVVQVLSEMGMSKGAILAFFISGPATGLSNLIIFKSAFNLRLLLVNLIINILGAILLGMIYNIY
jgi:uncharacterized protein